MRLKHTGNRIQNVIVTMAFVLLSAGCKHRAYNQSAITASEKFKAFVEGKPIKTPSRVTYMFHWTKNVSALSNPRGYIEGILNEAREKNPQPHANAGIGGHGLYLANDPFSSNIYGNVLLVVPIKANNEFKYFAGSGAQQDALIRDMSLYGFVYLFPGMLQTQDHAFVNHAAIVRHEHLIDWNVPIRTAKVTDLSAEEFDLKPERTWFELLKKNLNKAFTKNSTLFTTANNQAGYKVSAWISLIAYWDYAALLTAVKDADSSAVVVCQKVKKTSLKECASSILATWFFNHSGVEPVDPETVSFLKAAELLQPNTNPRTQIELNDKINLELEKKLPEYSKRAKSVLTLVREVMKGVEDEGSMLEWHQ